MKRILLFTVISFSFISCNNIFKKNADNSLNDSVVREYKVGNDQDDNGCTGSAGYTWSVLKNECIRLFESGYRLNPVEISSDDAVISAFVIFNDGKDKVELFLPYLERSVILDKKDDVTFANTEYIFNAKDFYLLKNNIKIYEAAKSELKNINDFNEEIID